MDPLRVIAIDDDEVVLDFVSEALSSARHAVLPVLVGDASSLAEIEAGAREFGPDVLVTDYRMPIAAEAVLRAVRAVRPGIRVVLFSGAPPRDVAALGADVVLLKPCRAQELIAAVGGRAAGS